MKHIQEEEDVEGHMFKPEICKGSKKILDKKKESSPAEEQKESIYRKKLEDDLKKQTPEFKPELVAKHKNIQREGKVDEMLYEDAKKRKEKEKE